MERDDIELRELRFLVAAAEEADLPSAARRLDVDELGLRDGLVALERKVGTRLLATTDSGVRLTDAGRHVLEGAEEVLAALDAARGSGHGSRTTRRTEVVDGRLEALEATLLELVSAFGMLASELALRRDLRLRTPREVEEALERGWRALVEESARVSPADLAADPAAALHGAMERTGAHLGALYEVAHAAAELRLLAAEGYPDEVMSGFAALPLDADLPASVAARSGKPLWFREREEILEEYPDLRRAHEHTEVVLGRRGDQGAVVPVSAGTRVVAVLVIGFAPDALRLRSV